MAAAEIDGGKLNMSNTQKTAAGGLTAALCATMMFLTGLIPIGQYAFPAIAGMVILSFSYAAGKRWAFYSFAATAVITIFICSDKEAVTIFTLILGYYPLIRDSLEKIQKRVLSYLIKLFIFNATAGVYYAIAIMLIEIDPEEFNLFGVSLPFLFLLFANLAFIMYDKMLKIFEIRYKTFIKKTIKNIFRQ